jgi:hypothetical protein
MHIDYCGRWIWCNYSHWLGTESEHSPALRELPARRQVILWPWCDEPEVGRSSRQDLVYIQLPCWFARRRWHNSRDSWDLTAIGGKNLPDASQAVNIIRCWWAGRYASPLNVKCYITWVMPPRGGSWTLMDRLNYLLRLLRNWTSIASS